MILCILGPLRVCWHLVLLATVVVFIVDVSGVVDAFKASLFRWLGIPPRRLKPFDCSLCMVWWSCLLYLLIVGHLTLCTVAFVALLATCSGPLGCFLQGIRALLQRAADALHDAAERH